MFGGGVAQKSAATTTHATPTKKTTKGVAQ